MTDFIDPAAGRPGGDSPRGRSQARRQPRGGRKPGSGQAGDNQQTKGQQTLAVKTAVSEGTLVPNPAPPAAGAAGQKGQNQKGQNQKGQNQKSQNQKGQNPKGQNPKDQGQKGQGPKDQGQKSQGRSSKGQGGQSQRENSAQNQNPNQSQGQAARQASGEGRRGRGQSQRRGRGEAQAPAVDPAAKLQIIPLGGLGEIGKNMTVIRYQDTIVIVDAGLAFPEEELLGIDVVIPDISYLIENKDKVKGLILTHGHEDHIGAVPYVLKQLDIPVYGTPLTLGLVEGKLTEHGLVMPEGSRAVKAGEPLRVGGFDVDLVHVNHSIPDAVAVAIHTPVGTLVHTGDFKFDHTPVDGQPADFSKLAELGDKGVLVLMMDSTNAERPGFTPSERIVGKALDDIIGSAEGRVLVATFASNVHRMQQVVAAAHKFNRRVAVVGRSMENTVEVARELGYLDIPEGTLIDVEEMERFPANQLVLLTTGSQGEPMSALTRMSNADHKRVEIIPGDTVLIAATPVPGNEKMVSRTINNLYRRGAEVIYPPKMLVHVSGHASQEEQKLMLNLVRPKFFVPVHGEYRMLIHNAQSAEATGVPSANILIGDNGTVFEFTRDSAAIVGRVTAGQTLIDGLGVGDVGNIVLRDRKQLSQDGILIVVVAIDKESGLVVSGPDVVTRGFVYVRESEQLMDEARDKVREALEDCEARRITEWSALKTNMRDALGKFLFDKTRRRPMILPIIVEV